MVKVDYDQAGSHWLRLEKVGMVKVDYDQVGSHWLRLEKVGMVKVDYDRRVPTDCLIRWEALRHQMKHLVLGLLNMSHVSRITRRQTQSLG